MESQIRLVRAIQSPEVAKILVRHMGIQFGERGEPNCGLGPPTVDDDFKAVVNLAADCIFADERATRRRIGAVISAGVDPRGRAAIIGELIASQLAERQSQEAGQPLAVDAIMVCREATSATAFRVRAYRRGVVLTNAEMETAVVGRRMLFTANVLCVAHLVTHVMKSALDKKLQGGEPPKCPEGLIAGVFAPAVRDRVALIAADQKKFVHFATTVFTFNTQEMDPRARLPRTGASGTHAVFVEDEVKEDQKPATPPPEPLPAPDPAAAECEAS